MIKVLYIFLAIFVHGSLTGQDQVAVASVSHDSILLGNVCKLKVELVNISANLVLPEMEDISIVSGPMQSQSISIINGEKTSKQVFSYTIEPLKEGEIWINPILIESKEGSFETMPISLQVYPNPENIFQPVPQDDLGNDFLFNWEFDNFPSNPFFQDSETEDSKRPEESDKKKRPLKKI